MPRYLVDISLTATLHMDADNERAARDKARRLLRKCHGAEVSAVDGPMAHATLAPCFGADIVDISVVFVGTSALRIVAETGKEQPA